MDVKNAVEAARGVKDFATAGPSTVRRSASIAALAAAMNKAQSKLKNPPKDSVNPHFRSKYADLATVRDAVTPALTENGLAVMQFPCELDDAPALTTLLTHTSGEWVETTIRLRPGKLDPQGVGSALTYARRYALQALAGVAADDDDDGHAATHRPAQQHQPAPAKDNPNLRASVAQAVAQAHTPAALTELWRRVEADLTAGVLADADREALIPLFGQRKKELAAAPAK